MPIHVCPLSKVPEIFERHKPSRVVSLLDPGSPFPEFGPAYLDKHLRLEFHDIHWPLLTHVPPGPAHVDRLLNFVNRWNPQESLLIHCRAGIGRSTATAFITACVHNPQIDEREIAAALRRTSPFARPNEVFVRIADEAMGRRGRMLTAIKESGRNLPMLQVAEAEAFELPSVYPARSAQQR
jgi:predicted protein tyrosine phosphatase